MGPRGRERQGCGVGKRGGVVLTPHLNKITKDRSHTARLNMNRSHGPTKTCKLGGRRFS